MPFARRFAIAFAVTLAGSAPLAAQGTAITSPSSERSASATIPAAQRPAVNAEVARPESFAPAEERAHVGVRAMSPSAPAPVMPPREDHPSKSVAMMIVGGAILVVGAVVEGKAGTIIMIGGGTIGIIGLIRYLQ
jgi:hypothetical protein